MTTHNRSSEELQIRDMVVAWGRKRWPDARVFHELTINSNRVDLAFIRPADLIAVEIKSSKDNLDRLPKQLETFERHFPHVYVAHAAKHPIDWRCRLVADVDAGTLKQDGWGWHRDNVNWRVYTQLLDILWAGELRAIGNRHLFGFTKKSTMQHMLPALAAKLTGEQILAEVCRELRGRHTFLAASDAPIHGSGIPAMPEKAPALTLL